MTATNELLQPYLQDVAYAQTAAELTQARLNKAQASLNMTLFGIWMDAATVDTTPGRPLVALPLPREAWDAAVRQSPAYDMGDCGSNVKLGYLDIALVRLREHPDREISRARLHFLAGLGKESASVVVPRESLDFVIRLVEGDVDSPSAYLALEGNIPFIRYFRQDGTPGKWGVLFPFVGNERKREYTRWVVNSEDEALAIAIELAQQTPAPGGFYRLPRGYRAREEGIPLENLFRV